MIDKRYAMSGTFAGYTEFRTGSRMEDTTEWIRYRDEVCYPVEKYLLGFAVRNKERLISAIVSNAFLNERVDFEQLRKIPEDKSLETIGDFVLDYAIIENFPGKESTTPKEINDFREFYRNNRTLHWFSKNSLHLQNYILWGPDERNQQRWDQPATVILADRFEMLIGVLYLEKGIDAVREFLKKHKFFEEIGKLT
jgi:ribonuclease-3